MERRAGLETRKFRPNINEFRMTRETKRLSREVTEFLDELHHPMRREIELLRQIIIGSVDGLTENKKWNGPNYCFENSDRVTMRVQPRGPVQLIFHRGVKKLAQPKSKLIDDRSGLLAWKGNDRAIVSFNSKADLEKASTDLAGILSMWIKAAM
jgi:hypothetical protein